VNAALAAMPASLAPFTCPQPHLWLNLCFLDWWRDGQRRIRVPKKRPEHRFP
jgi:hypothetical protein